jgi:hypothetical protein
LALVTPNARFQENVNPRANFIAAPFADNAPIPVSTNVASVTRAEGPGCVVLSANLGHGDMPTVRERDLRRISRCVQVD